jgi:hypothetical protein
LLDYAEWQKIEAAFGETEIELNGYLLNQYAGKINFGGDALEIQRARRSEWTD